MLKKVVASVLTSIGLFSLTANTALAKPADTFTYGKTLYPSNCSVFIKGRNFNCNYMVMGAFRNATANIKLCSGASCLILILSRTQLMNVANGRDFYVRKMAWQTDKFIEREWYTSMRCGLRSDEMSCMGRLASGKSIAIYVD